jgi:hypothetical protein
MTNMNEPLMEYLAFYFDKHTFNATYTSSNSRIFCLINWSIFNFILHDAKFPCTSIFSSPFYSCTLYFVYVAMILWFTPCHFPFALCCDSISTWKYDAMDQFQQMQSLHEFTNFVTPLLVLSQFQVLVSHSFLKVHNIFITIKSPWFISSVFSI